MVAQQVGEDFCNQDVRPYPRIWCGMEKEFQAAHVGQREEEEWKPAHMLPEKAGRLSTDTQAQRLWKIPHFAEMLKWFLFSELENLLVHTMCV